MNTERDKKRRLGGQRGAALVEFALIFPIFMTLVLGMFSGGQAYNQKSAMASATREGARYAATLSVASQGTLPNWLHNTANYVASASEQALGPGAPGWEICVAYVHLPSTGPMAGIDQTMHEIHSFSNPGSAQPGQCPLANDAPAGDKPRVQVTTRRDGRIQALFFEYGLTLSTRTITRFEALP